MELSKQEIELFLPLPGLWLENFFHKMFSFDPGNGIIQIGFGFISPTSRPLITKFFYKIFFIWSKGFNIYFENRKLDYPNRKWNHFSHFQASDQKTLKPPEASLKLSTEEEFRKIKLWQLVSLLKHYLYHA